MDFTESHKQTLGLVAFSPGGSYIMNTVTNRLIIRRVDTFQISRTCVIDDASPTVKTLMAANLSAKSNSEQDLWISHASWSADAELFMAACAKGGRIVVYKMRDESWNASINVGAEGLLRAEFAPDARSVLCFSQWGLRITVWSLVTGSATYIQYPIHPDTGYAFRNDGRYFILAERHRSKDSIGIYDVKEHFRLVRHHPCPTSSLASIAISPSGTQLAVWEGPLEFKLFIMSLSGQLQGTFSPPSETGLGIRAVSWHPLGHYLAVGGWDDKVYILSSLTLDLLAVLEIPTKISGGVAIWREPSESTQGNHGFISYERLAGPQALPLTKGDPTKAYPKTGVSLLKWNITGTHLLVLFESAATTACIYQFAPLQDVGPSSTLLFPPDHAPHLSTVMLHGRNITHAAWNPRRPGSLALACGTGTLYTWSDEWEGEAGPEEMAECIGIPAQNFELRKVSWSPDGTGMCLHGRDVFCCVFEVAQDDQSNV